MAEHDTDVVPESSSGGGTLPTSGSDAPAVTGAESPEGVTGEGEGRSLLNLKSEFDRKLGRLEQLVGDLVVQLGTRTAEAPSPLTGETTPQRREYTDTELAEMARMGSVDAYTMLIDRKVKAQLAERDAVTASQRSVEAQLSVLYTRYPMLARDPAHPLTSAALRARSVLVSQGYPQGAATDLEAIKITIADNPRLAAEAEVRPAQVGESIRQSSAAYHSASVEGNMPRRESTQPRKPSVSPKEAAVARRMGIADPAKAKERFLKRNEEGRSRVAHTIEPYIREEG